MNPESNSILEKNDDELLEELFGLLTRRTSGDPYGEDGAFAKCLADLPSGLRAMAATHWLDISLTLDSITWHFGNFGEPGLVAATAAGLKELGLDELAACFGEARDLMMPLVAERSESGSDYDELLAAHGVENRASEIDDRADALGSVGESRSSIHAAWLRYARLHPERVFNE